MSDKSSIEYKRYKKMNEDVLDELSSYLNTKRWIEQVPCSEQEEDTVPKKFINYEKGIPQIEDLSIVYIEKDSKKYKQYCEELSRKSEDVGFCDFILGTGEHYVYTICYVDEDEKNKIVFFDTYGPEKYKDVFTKFEIEVHKSFLEINKDKLKEMSHFIFENEDQCEFILLHNRISQLDGDCYLFSHVLADAYRKFFGRCNKEEFLRKINFLINKLDGRLTSTKILNYKQARDSKGEKREVLPDVFKSVIDYKKFIKFFADESDKTNENKNYNKIPKELYSFYKMKKEKNILIYKDGIISFEKIIKGIKKCQLVEIGQ